MPVTVRLLSGLLVALLVLLGPGGRPALAEPEWLELDDGDLDLIVQYAPGHEAEARWYGAFVSHSYDYIREVFGLDRRPGFFVKLYPDEASYAEANPVAGREHGVLAHARPAGREVGLATSRLREQTESVRRDAIRHEFTHMVLWMLAGANLPIGLHEGLAQYVEQDVDQRAKFARFLERAARAGQLLSFAELNNQRAFLSRAGIAYPQSYSMVVFLSDRYGFPRVVQLVAAMRQEESLEAAVQATFCRSLGDLEAEWRASLPEFLDGGWRRNELDLWEMAEPRRLLAAGQYAEARDEFERAARLFEGLGRAEKLEQARGFLGQSSTGLEATELSRRGSSALELHDYSTAADLLAQAEARWASLGDDSRRGLAADGAEQSRRGVEALGRLEQARAELGAWRIPAARAVAVEAGTTFVALGDAARTDETNAVLAEAQALQTRLGLAALGGGGLGLAALGFAWGARRRARPVLPPASQAPSLPGARERDWSL
jgi:hypothetical protein